MIDLKAWPLEAQIAFGLTPFVLCLSGIGIGVYIACSRHFKVMLKALENSPWLHQQVNIWGITSVKSRTLVVGSICGALLRPRLGIRKGVLDPVEISEFPLYLKRKMIISSWLSIIGFAWLMMGAGLLKLSNG
ncbi:hypothetical protein [Pseudomonas sp. 2(2015)]|uniref:hypothetical protein n=1 Tax=Pseudomonas sp. 2(2015) TaxID=1619950 RepID=UPI0005EB1855|nr:hypothetical protein [Pseudomonas sp. 2(2015)]KJK18918.1 hypothetical protein UB48_03820 [Pseudomonas sp. 2(2015)]